MSKILIADDVKEMRSLLGQLVDAAGYEFVEAASGEEVLELLQSEDHSIPLVLLDIGMPRVDGITIMQMIRDIDPEVKVCFVSGNKDKKIVASAISAGGNDYVVKPIDGLILLNKIKKLMGDSGDSGFLTLATKMRAGFPKIPIELEAVVTELSEVGLKFCCPMPLKMGERIELEIPVLAKTIGTTEYFVCEVDAVAKDDETGGHRISCSFYGQHENDRAKIRSVVIKGQEISE